MPDTTDSTHFNYFQLMDRMWTGFPGGDGNLVLGIIFTENYMKMKTIPFEFNPCSTKRLNTFTTRDISQCAHILGQFCVSLPLTSAFQHPFMTAVAW